MKYLAITAFSILITQSAMAQTAPLLFGDYTTDADLVKAAYAAQDRGDYATAAQDAITAANAGNAQAQGLLGGMYLTGHGEPQDCGQALHWFALSAKQGDVQSIYNFGVFYEHGICMPRNFTAAMTLYKGAAQAGWAEAQVNVGGMYDNAEGVPRDDVAAAKWFTMAADRNDPTAQLDLGLLAQASQGAAPDPVRAEMWMLLARKNATDLLLKIRIDEKIKALQAGMKPAQIAQGEALAAAWKPQPPVQPSAQTPGG